MYRNNTLITKYALWLPDGISLSKRKKKFSSFLYPSIPFVQSSILQGLVFPPQVGLKASVSWKDQDFTDVDVLLHQRDRRNPALWYGCRIEAHDPPFFLPFVSSAHNTEYCVCFLFFFIERGRCLLLQAYDKCIKVRACCEFSSFLLGIVYCKDSPSFFFSFFSPYIMYIHFVYSRGTK